RRGEHARQIRILTRTFRNAPPPRISRDIDHWRERPANTFRRCLLCRYSRRLARQFRIPSRCLAERNREYRLVSVDYIAPEQERNTEPAFPHRDSLRFGAVRWSSRIKERTPPPRANLSFD